jgi:hypothetical protein
MSLDMDAFDFFYHDDWLRLYRSGTHDDEVVSTVNAGGCNFAFGICSNKPPTVQRYIHVSGRDMGLI